MSAVVPSGHTDVTDTSSSEGRARRIARWQGVSYVENEIVSFAQLTKAFLRPWVQKGIHMLRKQRLALPLDHECHGSFRVGTAYLPQDRKEDDHISDVVHPTDEDGPDTLPGRFSSGQGLARPWLAGPEQAAACCSNSCCSRRWGYWVDSSQSSQTTPLTPRCKRPTRPMSSPLD